MKAGRLQRACRFTTPVSSPEFGISYHAAAQKRHDVPATSQKQGRLGAYGKLLVTGTVDAHLGDCSSRTAS